MRLLRRFLFVLSWGGVICPPLLGQTRNQELEEIRVQSPLRKKGRQIEYKLSREQVQALQCNDLGELLQRFPGVSLKSYGGLGGLKTISVRGIGGQHNTLLVDGLDVNPASGSSMDLSLFVPENIEEVSLGNAQQQNELMPLGAMMSGNVLSLKRFEYQQIQDSFQLRSNIKQASFGQWSSYLALKYSPERRKNWMISSYGMYRQTKGEYPFSIRNGQQNYQGNRVNNQLKEFYGGCNLMYQREKSDFLWAYELRESDQGLPGAVVLYNPIANQFLKRSNHRFRFQWEQKFRQLQTKQYLHLIYDELNYLDSAFLNQQGYIDQRYYTSSMQHGVVFRSKRDSAVWNYFGGLEQQWSTLSGVDYAEKDPARAQFRFLFGNQFHFRKSTLLLQLGHEFVLEQHLDDSKLIQGLSPFIQWERPFDQRFISRLYIWSKRSFRLPSFHELYYSQFGANSLKPEYVNQLNLGFTIDKRIAKKHLLQGQADLYYNLVQDKLVSIPTKNLFVWSVQNYGLVQIQGLSTSLSLLSELTNKFRHNLRLSYSLQQAIDLSSRESSSYRHQIPYIPLHQGTLDISLYYSSWSLHVQNQWLGFRYALPENIHSNEVPGFYVLDVQLAKRWEHSKSGSFQTGLSIKNLTNTSYAYVRYFVMPGIHYMIHLSYAFH
ncbi:MAG: hypothetical protein EP338_01455 [Bacteroidetes bacterium]|nr:MAG: hypothetical protein EP338_01455 [Bacteroidota bacterium]